MEYDLESDLENNQKEKLSQNEKHLKCHICDVSFSRKWCYDRHMQKQHSVCQLNYECCVCSEKQKTIRDLHNHLSDTHGISMVTEQRVFYSYDDFLNWKSDEEKKSIASFIRKHGTTKRKDGSMVNFFNCHRSGKPTKGPEQRKRAYKAGGSNKCGILCPARMKVVTSKHFGGIEIFVDYCSTHLGHDMEPRKLRLQKEEKDVLARKLLQGVPKEQILDAISKDFGISQRMTLTRRKDLHNLCQSYKINQTSVFYVDGYVNQMKLDVYNPVLIYKPYDEVSEEYPYLPREGFVLAIMNEVQQAVFQAYSGTAILVDSIRFKNARDMHLTTLMVIDGRQEGFPAALMYSTQITSETCTAFFTSIKNRCQYVETRVFMSADAPVFYSAWKNVFGDVDCHLLCTWHVLRAWIGKLKREVPDPEERKLIIQKLTAILTETDKEAFNTLLGENLVKFKENNSTRTFAEYFESVYLSCIPLWAHCYSVETRVHTNVMEWWNRQVKECITLGDSFKRLDKSIHCVMNATARKILGHLVTIDQCDLSYKVALLQERHLIAITMDLPDVCVLEEHKKWRVPSSHNSQGFRETYEVQFLDDNCACDVRCDDCKACIHSYSCMCLDYCVRFNMCKHIHYICQKYPQVVPMAEDVTYGDIFGEVTASSNTNEDSEAIEIFVITEMQDEEMSYLELQRAAAISQLQQLISRVESSSSLDEMQIILEAVDSASVKLDAITAAYGDLPAESVVLPQVFTDADGNVLNVSLLSKCEDHTTTEN